MSNFELQWSLRLKNLEDLRGYHKNPRKITDKQLNNLRTSIEKFGLIDKPFVNYDDTIIGGHQRIEILKLAGYIEIEVWVPNRQLTADEVEELNIRANQNTASWDYDILANEFDFDKLMEWGFTSAHLLDEASEETFKPKKAEATLKFRCDTDLAEVMDKLEALAQDWGCKLKIKVK